MLAAATMKCFTCKEVKPVDRFCPSHRIRPSARCHDCSGILRRERYRQDPTRFIEYAKGSYRKNGERVRARMRAQYLSDPEKFRQKARVYRRSEGALANSLKEFGITPDRYRELLAAQGGGCAICGAKNGRGGARLSVDHCHQTGKVRGILCGRCNVALGQFGDTAQSLQKAVNYLIAAESIDGGV